ncbi:MAG: transcriptional repressor [Anaerolineae bacterium]|jgi:Fe2+ or Zn2+ uptake regulation protein
MQDLQDLMDRVRQHGLRITRQRAIILQALCELKRHASAEEVYDRVTLHRRDLDLSTVYRTLETLHNLGIVSQTDLGHGCSEYEIVGEQPHHHLVCQHCGRIIELDDAYLATVAENIRQDFGFAPASTHFAIFGTCKACRAQQDQAVADGADLQPEEPVGASPEGNPAPAMRSRVETDVSRESFTIF